MKKLLLDTSILIDFLRRKDKERSLLVKINRLGYSPAISLITHTELFSGKSIWQKKRARRELEALLSGLEIILFNQQDSQRAGKIRARYQISLVDAIIAACALEEKLSLVTLNIKDFKKIKGLKLLRIKKSN